MPRESQSGFTLIEVLIAVCVVGILSIVVFPNYIQQREKTVATDLANSFRTYASALSSEDTMPEMSRRSAVGGHWEWVNDKQHEKVEISLKKHQASPALMERVDLLLDDGNLRTGILTGDGDHLTLVMHHKSGIPEIGYSD